MYTVPRTSCTFAGYLRDTSHPSPGRRQDVGNDTLRRALIDARLTEEDLAHRCEVDTKTVARWVTEDGRLPHPRHRYAACEALGVDEAVLWPDTVRKTLKTGPDREIITVYPYRSACPKSVWRSIIAGAHSDITF